MSLGRVDLEQQEFARRRNAAIMNSGHEFVALRLKDFTMKNVAGIDEVDAKPYDDIRTGGESWNFRIVGGCAHFHPDEAKGGAMYDYWVKTDHNMRFLASHWDDNPNNRYWEIEDPKIEKDVIKINKGMTKVATTVPQDIERINAQIKDVERQMLSCDRSQEPLLRQKKHSLLERIRQIATGEGSNINPEYNEEKVSDVVTTSIGVRKP